MNQDYAIVGCGCLFVIIAFILAVGWYGLIAYGIVTVIHYLEAHT